MLEWADDDLKIAGTELYLDSRRPRACGFVSHAHSDHLGDHQHAIATDATAAFAEHRLGPTTGTITRLPFRAPFDLEPDTRLELLPAGHVLGSAMLHVARAQGTLLYTGDFKLRRCPTVECAEPRPADVLVMETTYGSPIFRFPDRATVIEELIERASAALRDGRQPIVMGYTLGKSQEITRILTDAGLNVSLHGAVWSMHQIYERLGVPLGRVRRYAWSDFHGSDQLDLVERGVLVCPPYCARSPFVTSFENPLRIIMTGWALLKGAQYRYGVDHALPLSDHADYDELLELVERVRPKKVYAHHGYTQFAETLRTMGLDAEPARPDAQMSLFE
jgi:Cft2 family RNA processing exonuclease